MLFSNLKMGQLDLRNRIAMAPMTRSRATQPGDLANDMMREYYRQRASSGLLISEGIPISTLGRGFSFTPGLYTDEQVESWKPVTKEVHDLGGAIFAQIWHVGRTSHKAITGGELPISSSPTEGVSPAFGPLPEGGYGFLKTEVPREMTQGDIKEVIQQYVIAAENAIKAGFDGIELHGANGYLIEQFMHKATNKRTDEYGGSDENRIRFAVEVVTAVANAIGADKTSIRLSPYLTIDHPADDLDMPLTAIKFLEAIEPLGIAYVHFSENVMNFREVPLSFRQQVRDNFSGKVIIAGRYTKESAQEMLDTGLIDMVAFGEPYIANPDLVYRFKNDLELNEGHRESYYGGAEEGIIDYPVVDPDVFATDPAKQQAEAFILDYYRKFDAREAAEAFEEDFEWDGFLMSSPDRKIRTEQEYQQFYAETSEVFINSAHKVENFMMTRKANDSIEAACDVTFTAHQKPEPLTQIEVKGRIRFVLKPGEKPGSWKINQYLIEAA
ncbi:alkene reductase [Vibrio sp. JC009]|uniref:alkene reductase n=1 Tax=Vibrio sp. JC009 TaxID=2912314 RepID=UPI0023B1DDCA|nr:alkene reductase [Vibrio sp. JC009]WED23813.1 alkene reductase [Vibrio sp. JC009]